MTMKELRTFEIPFGEVQDPVQICLDRAIEAESRGDSDGVSAYLFMAEMFEEND